MRSALALEVVTGNAPAFAACIPDLARLRIAVFREFPYLYAGSLAYEEKYLATYTQCPASVAVLVRDGTRVVGVSSGLPLVAEAVEFTEPWLAAGYDPAEIFYCGESVLLREYRGRGVYREFFAAREAHARSLGGMRWMALCAVVRAADHPRRPADYVPLDAVWAKFGYLQQPMLTVHYPWQDLDEAAPSLKEMVFWLKALG